MNKSGKIFRILGIVLLGLTAAMNLLAGIGLTCVAFSSNVGYRLAFKELMDYRWLYQALVVICILIGIAGIWAAIKLVHGGPSVFRNALIILGMGVLFGGIHYFASMALRGKAAPANVKFYLNIFTLLVFLLFRTPGIWNKVDFSGPGGKNERRTGAGLAAIVTGILTLTIFYWAGPSHTFFQENWVYVLQIPLLIVGSSLTLGGIGILGRVVYEIISGGYPAVELDPSESY